MTGDEVIAEMFHDTYERLAPQFGYVTRPDTRKFDRESPNGKLMIAVCKEIREAISRVGGREADGWFLPSSEVNHIQVASINETIRRAKQAHYVDVRIRINGEYEFAQADWIKHMAATKEG